MNKFSLIRILIFQDLLNIAAGFGLSQSQTVLLAKQLAKRVGVMAVGSTAKGLASKGFKPTVLTQVLLDTRNFHLWIAASPDFGKVAVSLVSYTCLEVVGLAFGHFNDFGTGFMISGLRTSIATQVSREINPLAPVVGKITGLETYAIGVAAFCGKRGVDATKKLIQFVLKIPKGGDTPVILRICEPKMITNYDIIWTNIIQEHTTRRYLNAITSKQDPLLLIGNTMNSVSLNSNFIFTDFLSIFGWSFFGLGIAIITGVYLLKTFQDSGRFRFYKTNTNIIDVDYVEL